MSQDKLLQLNHRYILEESNYAKHHHKLEVLVLEVSAKAYKLKYLITDIIFWMDKDELVSNNCRKSGYFIFEDLGVFKSNPSQSIKWKGSETRICSYCQTTFIGRNNQKFCCDKHKNILNAKKAKAKRDGTGQ